MLLFILSNSNLCFSQIVNTTNPNCSELFLTEILFSKIPNSNNINKLNYAVEIYNPTSTSINLSNYDLALTNNGGTVTSIPLSGSLAAYKCHVVSNSNCDVTLSTISDALTSTLDFGTNISLQLRKNSIVIDEIGEGIPSTAANTPFDVVQFSADPQGYLANFDLNLDDYQNIDVRRSLLINRGEPNFDASTNLLGNWYYSLNTDLSDIGSFNGPCNPLSKPKVGFKHVSVQFNDQNWNYDRLELVHSLFSPVVTKYTISNNSMIIGSFNADARFENFTTLPTDLITQGLFNPSNSIQANQSIIPAVLGWPTPYAGNRCLDVYLSSVNNDFDVDPAGYMHRLCAKGNLPSSVQNLNQLTSYFAVDLLSNILILESLENLSGSMYNIYGQLLNTITIKQGVQKISINQLPKGIYLLQLTNSKKQVETKKFVIQ